MRAADAKSAIDHLPLETEGIVLTGGEVTVVKETLREVAEYVHAVRAERFPHLKLSMETNGTWVHDQHSAYLGMLELHSWGIDQIIFSGNDEAHAQAGLNTDLIMRGHDSPVSHAAERIAFELYRLGIPYTPPEFGGAWFHLPLGRALETQTDFRNFLPCFHQRSSVREGLTMAVDVDGRLSPCVFGVVPSMGSIFDNDYNALMAKALTDPVLGTLMAEGSDKVAEKFGISLAHDPKETTEDGCVNCISTFGALKERRII